MGLFNLKSRVNNAPIICLMLKELLQSISYKKAREITDFSIFIAILVVYNPNILKILLHAKSHHIWG